MKTSNKIVWGSFVGLFAITVMFLVALKIFLGGDLEATGEAIRDTTYGSREIDVQGLTGVDLKGHWRAEIIQGTKEQMVVEGPEDLLAVLSVSRRGTLLALHLPKQDKDAGKLHVTVRMPDLHTLRTKGVVDMRLGGLDTEHLFIRTDGVSSIRGKDGRIKNFRFKGRGVTKMDLRDVPVRTADLDCKGVIKIDLTMDGGALTGSIKGVGELRYAGKTSRMSIQQEGPCKITHQPRTWGG